MERKETKNPAIGENVLDFMETLLTPEEIAASDLRVALISAIIEARNEKGLSQRQMEEITGVKQPVISRIESGASLPQIDTLIKLLLPLGKKLTVVPITE